MLARRLVLGSAVLAALSVMLVAALWVVTSARGPADAPAPTAAARPPDAVAALAAWDRRRARAWEAGDVTALEALYVDDSRTGRRDVQMLQAYVDRGLSVRGLRTQVLRAEVLRRGERSVVLAVTDRMRGAVAVGADRRIHLPADRASTHEVGLRRVGDTWLVEEVRG